MAYIVVKTIKGRKYLYRQESRRVNGKVVTTSTYIGPAASSAPPRKSARREVRRRRNGLSTPAMAAARLTVKATYVVLMVAGAAAKGGRSARGTHSGSSKSSPSDSTFSIAGLTASAKPGFDANACFAYESGYGPGPNAFATEKSAPAAETASEGCDAAR